MKQVYRTIQGEGSDTEWLYVPDVLYHEYSEKNESETKLRSCQRYLQLFVPYRHKWETKEIFPLVIFIPGSAWYRQEMYNSIPNYSKLAEKGFVTAVVQYRESNLVTFPGQIEDVIHAVNFLLEKESELHIDRTKIFIAGNSSGGHIALLTMLMKAIGAITGDFSINGVIAESAPTDLFLCAKEKIPEWMPEDFRPVKDLLGVNDISENMELASSASCEMYIKKEIDIAPVLLIHGTKDPQVSVEHSRKLFKQLEAAEKQVTFYEIIGADHGGQEFWADSILTKIEDFIKEN